VCLGDLAEHVGRGFAQPALDLTAIRIADTGLVGQLSHRDMCRLTLRPDEAADVVRGIGHRSGKIKVLRHGSPP
jgi:hypothetical protein